MHVKCLLASAGVLGRTSILSKTHGIVRSPEIPELASAFSIGTVGRRLHFGAKTNEDSDRLEPRGGPITVTVTHTHIATPEWCVSKPTTMPPLFTTSCTTKTSTISGPTSIGYEHASASMTPWLVPVPAPTSHFMPQIPSKSYTTETAAVSVPVPSFEATTPVLMSRSTSFMTKTSMTPLQAESTVTRPSSTIVYTKSSFSTSCTTKMSIISMPAFESHVVSVPASRSSISVITGYPGMNSTITSATLSVSKSSSSSTTSTTASQRNSPSRPSSTADMPAAPTSAAPAMTAGLLALAAALGGLFFTWCDI
ncbi:hypothetical protein LTR36_007582 [Oleoguttula mirabilis]|uniref:Uncharacterized protein n=1 Tax=Oleoguttula mirabilis TaxID=1507867 RepID=A0AAV9JU65_9PEZI|nr:hypothetical protein LTR36_007582 [Oleoguttula mirabilis]